MYDLSPLLLSRTSGEPADAEEALPARAERARDVYQRAYRSLRENQPDDKEEAVMLLEAWKEFEAGLAEAEGGAEGLPADEVAANLEKVQKKMPKRVKRKRPIRTEDGMEVGQEEYYDYIFPEEAGAAPHLKLLELAYKHKRQKMAGAATDGGGVDDAPEGI